MAKLILANINMKSEKHIENQAEKTGTLFKKNIKKNIEEK